MTSERSYYLAKIEAERTAAGGWKKRTLARWGVPWPPTHGWKDRLVDRWLLDDQIAAEWPDAWALAAKEARRSKRSKLRNTLRRMFKAERR